MIGSPIDMTPLQLSEIQANGLTLVARPGFECAVERVDDGLLSTRIDGLGVCVYGSTRQALSDSLELAIAEAWCRYFDEFVDAAADQTDACLMRCRLISHFHRF